MYEYLNEKKYIIDDDRYLTDSMINLFEKNGLDAFIDYEDSGGYMFKYPKNFKCLVIFYIKNFDNKRLRNIAYELIKYHFSHQSNLGKDEILEIYAIARIYNINKVLNLGYSYKNGSIKNILSLFENFYNEGQDEAFQFGKGDKYVNYSNFFIKFILGDFIDAFDFFDKAFSLCDCDFLIDVGKFLITSFFTNKENIKRINPHLSLKWILVFCELLIPIDVLEEDISAKAISFFYKYKDIKNRDNSPLFPEQERLLVEKYTKRILDYSYFSGDCLSFYIIAEQMMEAMDSSLFVDYSICSLQFFKIIEIILKKNIIAPSIPDDYNGFFNDMTKKPVYIKRDKDKITGGKQIETKETWINKLTLDKIHYLMSWVFEEHKGTELSPSSISFIENIKKKLNCDDVIKSNELIKFIIDCTHHDILMKFRNPPAHTKPSTRNDALEAKEIMFELLDYLDLIGQNFSDEDTIKFLNKDTVIQQSPSSSYKEYLERLSYINRKTLDNNLDLSQRYKIAIKNDTCFKEDGD